MSTVRESGSGSQRAKSRLGLYSPVMRTVRQTSKGKVPTPLGLFTKKR